MLPGSTETIERAADQDDRGLLCNYFREVWPHAVVVVPGVTSGKALASIPDLSMSHWDELFVFYRSSSHKSWMARGRTHWNAHRLVYVAFETGAITITTHSVRPESRRLLSEISDALRMNGHAKYRKRTNLSAPLEVV